MKRACLALYKGLEVQTKTKRGRDTYKVVQEVLDFELYRVRKNGISGYWALDSGSYGGDIDDQEYVKTERWKKIIRTMNMVISENR